MKKIILSLLLAIVAVGIYPSVTSRAQEKPAASQTYEYGMIKWDGPDKLQFILPEKTEVLHAFRSGLKLPESIHDEEMCVVWALNRVAKDGWEPVTLHATRVLIRRPIK